jgi:hypothetical protein
MVEQQAFRLARPRLERLVQMALVLALLAAGARRDSLRRSRLAAEAAAGGADQDGRSGRPAGEAEALRARLIGEVGLGPERFTLELRDRVAILRGTVDWPAQIAASEALLRRQLGVLDVVSFLLLSGSTDHPPRP